MNVTKEQALAFFEALLGWELFSAEHGRSKSPHARAHLEAILGQGNVQLPDDFRFALASPEPYTKWQKSERRKAMALLDYLEAVVRALKPEEAQP
jgi:hypothetical protein